MKLLSSSLASLMVLAAAQSAPQSARAQGITMTSTKGGLVIDEGATGEYTLGGPTLSFAKPNDPKKGMIAIKPVFSPAADGQSGTIDYPKSPGEAKLNYTLSATDGTVTFTFDQPPTTQVQFDFEMDFMTSQFFGGLYIMGDKPPVTLPIDLLPKAEFTRDKSFSLAGRDGVGLNISGLDGTESFADSRKYNTNKYVWRYTHRFAPTEKTLVLTFAAFKTTPPATALKPAGPPADAKWEPMPELTDEFDGSTLDTTKWYDHNPGWAGRSPSYFAADNVKVSDGNLQLLARLQDPPESLKPWPSFKNYSLAAVVSKHPTVYGYYECRAKVMDVNVDNAFWFFTPLPTPPNEQHVGELDVFEIQGRGDKFDRILFNTMHIWKSPEIKDGKPWAKSVEFRMPARAADDYHVYAIDWEKDQIRCWYDGYQFSHFANTGWNYPQNLEFDVEIQPQWFGMPAASDFHGTYSVDYVRSWKHAGQSDATPPTDAAH